MPGVSSSHQSVCRWPPGPSRRDRCSRPTRTAARRVRQVAGVVRHRGRGICERGGVRLAQEDAPALAQLANDRGVIRANSALVNVRTVFRCQTLGLDDVFHTERNPAQRASSCRVLRKHLDPRLDVTVERSNAIDARLQRVLPRSPGRSQPLGEGLEPWALCRKPCRQREIGKKERPSINPRAAAAFDPSHQTSHLFVSRCR